MKVLVLTGSTNETSYQSITSFLAQIGVPYQAVELGSVAPNSAGSRLPQVPLSDSATGQGLYQGIILTDSTFAACGSSCLSTADWTTLNTYATQFSVRIASYYTKPAAQWGLLPVGAAASYTAASPLSVTLTTAGAAVFAYLNSANPISVAGDGTSPINAYLATPTAAVNETTTPLLTSGAYTVAVTHTNAAGQETLALTMDNGPTLMHSFAFGYGVINWVTKGIFLGSRKVYLNNQTDDLLLGNWIYAPSLHPACEASDDGCPTYFETGPDLHALANWQANLQADPLFQSYRQTFAVNGVGTTWFPASDPIFAAMKSLNSQFWWMSHTWDHPNLDCYATTDSGTCVPATLEQSLFELNQDIAVVPTLGVTFDETGMVTPYNSGLANPDFLQAAAQVGIKYIVDPELPDSPNTGIVSPLVPSILYVTRLNNDLFYDVSSPLTGVYGSWPDEYNSQYGPGGVTPTYSENQTYSQILDNLSQEFLQINVLTYAPYVIESHIANIATYDGTNSVFTDLMNVTIAKYEKLFTLPVLTLDLENIGAVLTARTNYNASGVVGVYTPGVSVVLTTTNGASVPLTGLCSQATCGTYGGQIQDSVVMAAGSSVTIPVTANVGVSLSTVAVKPASVAGGLSAAGTITLSGAAPVGGVTVSLASNSASATLPVTVTVASGSNSAAFSIATSKVTSSALAILTASYGGVSKTAALTITPAASVSLSSVATSPASVSGGTSVGGTITLSGAAPTGGVTVSLASNSASATLPATVMVAAGSSSANFTVSTSAVTSSASATLTASYSGVSKTTALTITPAVPVPQTITFNAIAPQTAGTAIGLSATASSGLPVTFSSATANVCILSGGTASFLAPGTCTITASQAGNGSYLTATPVSRSFAVVSSLGTLSVATLQFGVQAIGAASTAQTATLTNTGAATLSISVTLGGLNAADFHIDTSASTCSSTLAASASCRVTVNFVPTAGGIRTAQLQFVYAAGGSPQSVTLSGTGLSAACSVSLSPAAQVYLSAGDSDMLTVTDPSACTWSASSNVAWITFSGSTSGSAGQSLPYIVSANTTAQPRTGTITVGVATTTITQSGVGLRFIPLTPCRVLDTTRAPGPLGGPRIAALTTRNFTIPGVCGVPTTAQAYAINVTVVPAGSLHYVTIYPAGQTQPLVSTINSPSGLVKANAAIIPAGVDGAITAFATDATDLIIDINGYFVLSSDTSALSFYPITPCRLADSRLAGSLGAPYLSGQQVRDFPLRDHCGIPSTAQAYSLNFTAVPRTGKLNYLSVWPSGVAQPQVSTLNDPQGQVVANAAIVPAGAGGSISAFVTQDADLIIDVNGYFAPPQGSSGLSFYNLTPCRAFDSRLINGGAPLNGITVVNPNSCPVPLSQVRAYVFNATVVPSSTYHYLTLWQDGNVQPLVSTLNGGGSVSNNMAIVPSVNGLVDAFTTDPTALILDVFGYFGP